MSSSSSAIGDCRSYNSMSPSTPLPMVKKKKGSSSDVMVQHKERPKIKIIHIIAPEIIKTDVANFRDLVQRLTGKQKDAAAAAAVEEEEEKEETITIKKRTRPVVEKSSEFVQEENSKKKIKCEVKVEEGGFGYDQLDQNDLWMDLNPGGFLSFLEEDVYMAAELFQSPLGSSRMDFVGEMYAS